MMSHIKISKVTSKVSVRAAGAVIAESGDALELIEGDMGPVYYIPRHQIAMAFLEPTDQTSHCPYKGDARYFTIETKSGPLKNAAWSYETPSDDVAQIKDHIAFYNSDNVSVELL